MAVRMERSRPRNETETDANGIEVATTAASPLTRRKLLGRVGLGAATVFVVADGLVSYRAWDQGVLNERDGPAFDALADWKSFTGPEAAVAAAVLAASAHNTQPWLFAVEGARIDLYADLTRTTGANDPLNRELFVSLGCALENLVLAAQAGGSATAVTLGPGTATDLVATVDLSAAAVVESNLYQAIPKRRSNRSEFTSAPVEGATMSAMSALADDGVFPARLVWIDSTDNKRRFADLLVQAAEAHRADEQASKDSFAWWRGDWDDVQSHKDGLNINGVGLPPLLRTLGKILPGSSRQAADDTFVERTRLQADSAAAFGVITVANPDALAEQLAGGRYLERLHLWAAAHGVGFQHMNQITERVDRDRQQGTEGPFANALIDLVGPGVLAAFRIGTPLVASMASPRRPVTEVLT